MIAAAWGPSWFETRENALLTMRVEPSTPAIGRVAPGRDQKRHVEMAFRLAHRKPQGDAVEKGRIRYRHPSRGKIIRRAKVQFVIADRHRPAVDQRLIAAAVAIGDPLRDDAVLAE